MNTTLASETFKGIDYCAGLDVSLRRESNFKIEPKETGYRMHLALDRVQPRALVNAENLLIERLLIS